MQLQGRNRYGNKNLFGRRHKLLRRSYEKKYVAHTVTSGETSEKVFISCLVNGKVSLFYFQERYFIDSANGLQELVTSTTNVTRDGKVYSQPLPVYKGVLQTAMGDCSTIHENLKNTSLKKNGFISPRDWDST